MIALFIWSTKATASVASSGFITFSMVVAAVFTFSAVYLIGRELLLEAERRKSRDAKRTPDT